MSIRGGANIGGCASMGAGGVGPCTDMAAGRWGVILGMGGIGVERGGGGDAGLVAQVRETDWGLLVDWIGESCTGMGGAGVAKKDIGEENIPAEGGGPSCWLGVIGGP